VKAKNKRPESGSGSSKKKGEGKIRNKALMASLWRVEALMSGPLLDDRTKPGDGREDTRRNCHQLSDPGHRRCHNFPAQARRAAGRTRGC